MPTWAKRRASAAGAETRAASGSAPPAAMDPRRPAQGPTSAQGPPRPPSVEIVAQRRAERRLVAARDTDRIDNPGPGAARVRAKRPATCAPPSPASAPRVRPRRGRDGAPQFSSLGVTLLSACVRALRRRAPRRAPRRPQRAPALRLLKPRDAERAALALDRRIFRL